jgi:hypothetical protein
MPNNGPTDRGLSVWMARLDERLEQVQSAQTTLTHLLTGNGTPEKGVLMRVDRLEQSAQRREAWSKTAITTAAGAAIAAIGAWFKS